MTQFSSLRLLLRLVVLFSIFWINVVFLLARWSLAAIDAAPITSHRAVVVGGGPAGLATALILARNHAYQVTVVERNTKESYTDPTLAYSYAVNFRGQSLTQRFPEIHQALQKHGVASDGFSLKRVPGDPRTVFDQNRVLQFPLKMGIYYHIARHALSMILIDILEKERNVEILWGCEVDHIDFDNRQGEIDVHVLDETTNLDDRRGRRLGTRNQLRASLLVGADGFNSKVREILSQSTLELSAWTKGNECFTVKQWKSPSYGIRVKTIRLRPDIMVPVGDGSLHEVPFGVPMAYGLDSIHKKPTKRLVLVLFPSREVPYRSCVIATSPDHEVWNIRNGHDMKVWFKAAFPRFNFTDESSPLVVDPDEWDRFAQSEGTRFPSCQLCPAMYTTNGNSSVILIGDAVHSFPPDVGEGINCAMADVAALDDAMTNHKDNLTAALEEYENIRLPEAKAIVRMCRFAAPYQYEQARGLERIPAILWQLNAFLRILLNKLSFGILPLPVIFLKGRQGMTYVQALRQADLMTTLLWLILFGAACKVVLF